MEARQKLESLLDAIDFKNVQYDYYIKNLTLDLEEATKWLSEYSNLRRESDSFKYYKFNQGNKFYVEEQMVSEEDYAIKYPEKYARFIKLNEYLNLKAVREMNTRYRVNKEEIQKLIKDDYKKANIRFEKWYESLLVRFSDHLIKAGAVLENLTLNIVSDGELLVSDGVKEIHARFIHAGGDQVRRHIRYILTTRKLKG